jgi:hypothetical protein
MVQRCFYICNNKPHTDIPAFISFFTQAVFNITILLCYVLNIYVYTYKSIINAT